MIIQLQLNKVSVGGYLNDDYTVIENRMVYQDILGELPEFEEFELFKSDDLRQVYKEYLKARYGEIIERAIVHVGADECFYKSLNE